MGTFSAVVSVLLLIAIPTMAVLMWMDKLGWAGKAAISCWLFSHAMTHVIRLMEWSQK